MLEKDFADLWTGEAIKDTHPPGLLKQRDLAGLRRPTRRGCILRSPGGRLPGPVCGASLVQVPDEVGVRDAVKKETVVCPLEEKTSQESLSDGESRPS